MLIFHFCSRSRSHSCSYSGALWLRSPFVFRLCDGQNLAGYCIMRLSNCAKGNLIRLRYAETTWPDANGETRIYNQFQSCALNGAQCAFQEDTYICNGRGQELYEPTATYVSDTT